MLLALAICSLVRSAARRVVVLTPALSQHARFLHQAEDLPVEKLIAHLRVEAFAVAKIPENSAAWVPPMENRFDVACLRASSSQPLPQFVCGQRGAIVRTEIFRPHFLTTTWTSVASIDTDNQLRSTHTNNASHVCSLIRSNGRGMRLSCVRTLSNS